MSIWCIGAKQRLIIDQSHRKTGSLESLYRWICQVRLRGRDVCVFDLVNTLMPLWLCVCMCACGKPSTPAWTQEKHLLSCCTYVRAGPYMSTCRVQAFPTAAAHTLRHHAYFFVKAEEEWWEGGFGGIGIPNTMKSHFAFCLPCMTEDKASHKWGLTFHLAEGEEGSLHDGKATVCICGHSKMGILGFWGD